MLRKHEIPYVSDDLNIQRGLEVTQKKPRLLYCFGFAPRAQTHRAPGWQGAISSSLYVSHHPSPVLKSAGVEPALPALSFSIISGAAGRQMDTGVSDTGGSRKVSVAPFQALRQ